MFKPKLFTTMKTYDIQQFQKDAIAGLTVAVIALPLSIALATASGVGPEKGLITAIIAGFLISFLGGSRVQIGGPTGAFMVIVSTVVYEHGVNGLILATFMAGFIMILFGLMKLGNVIKYIPHTITTGFTNGIAVVIVVSQLKDFFGLKSLELPNETGDKLITIFENIKSLDFLTLVVGILTLAFLLLWPRISRKVPGAILAIIGTTVLVKVLGLDVQTIGDKFSNISLSLDGFGIPDVSVELLKELFPAAISIAVLGSIESLLSAVVSDGMIGGRHRSNMELIAQGVANVFSAMFGGIPATGAIARTAANVTSGGRTPVAGMLHAVFLGILSFVFMPLINYIPLVTLAAILMIVAYNMMEKHIFKELPHMQRADVLVFLVTFILTIFVDLIVAIELGMVLAAFTFIKRIVEMSEFKEINGLDSSEEEEERLSGLVEHSEKKFENSQTYRISGPFFFGTAHNLLDLLYNINHHTKNIFLIMEDVNVIDSTGIHYLEELNSRCRDKHMKLYLVDVNDHVKNIIQSGKAKSLFEMISKSDIDSKLLA